MGIEETPKERETSEQSTLTHELCDQIRTAQRVHRLARHASAIAEQTISQVRGKTFYAQAAIRVLLTNEESESYVVHDDEVVETSPHEFIATELGSMGVHHVEFYNRDNERRLVIPLDEEFDVEPADQQPPQAAP